MTASSSRTKDSLPYQARIENSLGGWIPLKASEKELHALHFIQVDLRKLVNIKMVRTSCKKYSLINLPGDQLRWYVRPLDAESRSGGLGTNPGCRLAVLLSCFVLDKDILFSVSHPNQGE